MMIRCKSCQKLFHISQEKLATLNKCPGCGVDALFDILETEGARQSSTDLRGGALSLVDDDSTESAADSSDALPVGGQTPYGSPPQRKPKPIRPKRNPPPLKQSQSINQSVNVVVHGGGASTPATVIIGFICSLLCIWPLGLILCGIGYGEAKRKRAGEGLAIAGIVISLAQLAWQFVVFVVPVLFVGAVAREALKNQPQESKSPYSGTTGSRYETGVEPTSTPWPSHEKANTSRPSEPTAKRREQPPKPVQDDQARKSAERDATKRAIDDARSVVELEEIWERYRTPELEQAYNNKRAELLAKARTAIIELIEKAESVGEVQAARRRYVYDEGADELDTAVTERLGQIAKGELDSVVARIRKATTFEEIAEAAAGYGGKEKEEVAKAVKLQESAIESKVLVALKDEAKRVGAGLLAINDLLRRLRNTAKRNSRCAKDLEAAIADVEKKQRPLLEDAKYFDVCESIDARTYLKGWKLLRNSVSFNGNTILAAGEDEQGRTAVHLIDVASQKAVASHYVSRELKELHLASGCAVAVFRCSGGVTVLSFDGRASSAKEICTDGASACAVSRDGKRVVVGMCYYDKENRPTYRPLTYNASTGKLINEPLVTHKSAIAVITFAPSGGYVTLDANGGMGSWDSEGRLTFQYSTRTDTRKCTHFVATSGGLAIGMSGSVSFMSLGKDVELFSLAGFAGDVIAVTSTTKDRYLAVADSTGLVRIYDSKTREAVKSFDLKSADVIEMSWSNDGLTLHVITASGTIVPIQSPRN